MTAPNWGIGDAQSFRPNTKPGGQLVIPTKEWVESQGGVYHGEYHWPLEVGEEAYWIPGDNEPLRRCDYHIGDRVIVYQLPTEIQPWPPAPFPGTPYIYRFFTDADGYVTGATLLTEDEVATYRASRGHL